MEEKKKASGWSNLNGISDDDKTCGLNDMNCLGEDEQTKKENLRGTKDLDRRGKQAEGTRENKRNERRFQNEEIYQRH